MKKIVRLNESDIRRMVNEAVRLVLNEEMDEGQGLNWFKQSRRSLRDTPDTDFSDFYAVNSFRDDLKNDRENRKNFIKYGIWDDHPEYSPCNCYDDEGNHSMEGTPINYGLSGRLGRRLAYDATVGMAAAKKARGDAKNFIRDTKNGVKNWWKGTERPRN